MVDGKQYIVIATSGARDKKSPQGAAYVGVCFTLSVKMPRSRSIVTPACANSDSIFATDPSRSIARQASRTITASNPSRRASSAEYPTQ